MIRAVRRSDIRMQIVEIRKEKRGRLLVVTEEVGMFPVYEKEAAAFHLEEGSVLSDSDWNRLCTEVLRRRVIRRAMFLLQRMDRTEFQLRQKLAQDHYPDFLIDAAVNYVRSYHYIDDLRYASTYIRLHQTEKSRIQLKLALQNRGISRELIDQALEETYEDHEDEQIRCFLLKKQYDPKSMDQRQKWRIYQNLCRKGFSSYKIKQQMDLT